MTLWTEGTWHMDVWDAVQHGRRSGQMTTDTLRDLRPFHDLSEPMLLALSERARWRRYRSGENVITTGMTERTIYVVLHGVVRVGGVGPAGREIACFFLGAGDVLDVVEMPAALVDVTYVRAMVSDAIVIAIPDEQFRQVVSTQLSLAMALLDQWRQRLYETALLLADCLYASSVVRYGHLLGKLGPLYPGQLIPATHEEIAGMGGMSRSGLEIALPRFKAAGYVDYEYGESGITVLDIDSLLHIEDRIEGA